MSPTCFAQSDDEGLLGVRLRLGRRVGEHRVDLRGDLRRAIRVRDREDVPVVAIAEAAALGDRFSQELVVEDQLRLVGALDLRVVDAVDGELPRTAVGPAVDRALDRNALADLEAVLLRRVAADDRAGAVGEQRLLLILGELELLRIDPQPALGLDRECRRTDS